MGIAGREMDRKYGQDGKRKLEEERVREVSRGVSNCLTRCLPSIPHIALFPTSTAGDEREGNSRVTVSGGE